MSDKDYMLLAAKAAEEKLPDEMGIMLFAVPFNGAHGNILRYTSDLSREDAIRVVKAWLYEQGEDEKWMKHIN